MSDGECGTPEARLEYICEQNKKRGYVNAIVIWYLLSTLHLMYVNQLILIINFLIP